MDSLALIIHHVERGSAISLVESPNGYVTHINLGGSTDYSPLEHLYSHLRVTTDTLYITHFHPDQLVDISAASNEFLKPATMQYLDYPSNLLHQALNEDGKSLIKQFEELSAAIPRGDYHGEGTCWWKHWKPEFAAETFGPENALDNSGMFIIYTWRDFKIIITADQEAQAIDYLLNDRDLVTRAYRPDILIVPRHGHESGFTHKWIDTLGKPYLTIISDITGEKTVPEYNSPEFARGIFIHNRQFYCLNTGTFGTISINMHYTEDGKPGWAFYYT